ncbi:unnamed protein product [Oikopleura dioica]|uniref:Uncharacterized protein n=1 Tax=Oikopleura dioica TaxID=34765 RepID=E4XSY0_OIKDI|nr:unnamed protein product [Oikopleura dioica]
MAGIWYEAGRKRNRSKPCLTPAGLLSTESCEEIRLDNYETTSGELPLSYAETVRQASDTERTAEDSMQSDDENKSPLDPLEPNPTIKVTTRLTKMFFGKLTRKQQRGSRSVFIKKGKEDTKKSAKKRKSESKTQGKTGKRAKRGQPTTSTQQASPIVESSIDYEEVVTGPLPNLKELQTAEEEIDPASTTAVIDASELDPSFRSPEITEQQTAHPSERLAGSIKSKQPLSFQPATTRYDSDGNQLPPTGFEQATQGMEELLLVSEIFQYLSVGQLELYRLRGPGELSFGLSRLYAAYYSLIGFTSIFLQSSSKSISMVAKNIYRVLVAAQTGPAHHSDKVTVLADQVSALLENLVDVARSHSLGKPMSTEENLSVKSLVDSLILLVEEDDHELLLTAVSTDLSQLATGFKMTDHVVACISFSMEKMDELAKKIAATNPSGTFSGYRAQIVTELPRQSQQYLQDLGVILEYPTFKVKASKLTDKTFGVYIENYLNSLPEKGKRSSFDFKTDNPTSKSRFPVPPLTQVSQLGSLVKSQREALLKERQDQAARAIQDQLEQVKEKSAELEGSLRRQLEPDFSDFNIEPNKTSQDPVGVPPTETNNESTDLYVVDFRGNRMRTYRVSPISNEEFKQRFLNADRHHSEEVTICQPSQEPTLPTSSQVSSSASPDQLRPKSTNRADTERPEQMDTTVFEPSQLVTVSTRSSTRERSKSSATLTQDKPAKRDRRPSTLYQETFGTTSDEEESFTPSEAQQASSQLEELSISPRKEICPPNKAGLVSAGRLFQSHPKDEKSRLRAWSIPARPTAEIPSAIDSERQFPSARSAALSNRIEFALVQNRKHPTKARESWEIGQATFREFTQALVRAGESTKDCDMQKQLKELEEMSSNMTEEQIAEKTASVLTRLVDKPSFCSSSEPILSLRILQPGLFNQHSTFENDQSIEGISRGTYVFGHLIGPLAFTAIKQVALKLIVSQGTALQTEVVNTILLRSDTASWCLTNPGTPHRTRATSLFPTCSSLGCASSGGCCYRSSTVIVGLYTNPIHDILAVSRRLLHLAKHGQLRFLREMHLLKPSQASSLLLRYREFGRTPTNQNVMVAPRESSLSRNGEDEATTVAGVGPLFNHAGEYLMLNFPPEMQRPENPEFQEYHRRLILLKVVLSQFGFKVHIHPSGNLRVNTASVMIATAQRLYNYASLLSRADPTHQHLTEAQIESAVPYEQVIMHQRVPFVFSTNRRTADIMNNDFYNKHSSRDGTSELFLRFKTVVASIASPTLDPPAPLRRSDLETMKMQLAGLYNPFKSFKSVADQALELRRLVDHFHQHPLDQVQLEEFLRRHCSYEPASRMCKVLFCSRAHCKDNQEGLTTFRESIKLLQAREVAGETSLVDPAWTGVAAATAGKLRHLTKEAMESLQKGELSFLQATFTECIFLFSE